MPAPRLMAVLAHPDDESLGVGGTLAKYAAEGVEVFLLTATRGDGGSYRGYRDVALLEYRDQQLDRADPRQAIADIVAHLRRVRPDVVVTFAADGAYGHPD